MAEPHTRSMTGSLVVGAVLAAAGALALGFLFAAVYSATPELASIGLRLGLAFGAFFSGLAQVALVAGIWIIWSALRGRDR